MITLVCYNVFDWFITVNAFFFDQSAGSSHRVKHINPLLSSVVVLHIHDRHRIWKVWRVIISFCVVKDAWLGENTEMNTNSWRNHGMMIRPRVCSLCCPQCGGVNGQLTTVDKWMKFDTFLCLLLLCRKMILDRLFIIYVTWGQETDRFYIRWVIAEHSTNGFWSCEALALVRYRHFKRGEKKIWENRYW